MKKKGDAVELHITDLAFGGAGVGKLKMPDGGDFTIFVEGVAPGDRVTARLTRIKKNFSEARLERIIEPAPNRITPRCKHFGVCGGCAFQFLSYEDQLKWKEKIVRDAIERIGGFADAHILKIHGSPSPWFYRNKMEFSWGEAAVPPMHAAPLLGLHRRGKFDEVFDLEECYLQSKFSVEAIAWLKEWAAQNRLKPFDPRTSTGFLKNLVIREARSTGEWMLNLITADEPFPQREKFAAEITHAFPQITSLFHTAVHVQKGRRTEIIETLLAGKPFLTEIMRVPGMFREGENFLSLIFDIAPQAFFQTNSQAAEHLLAVLLALGAARPDDVVFDLYCGTGILGMFFAKLARQVYGVELNASAIGSARRNAEKNGLSNIEFFCGDAASAIEKIPEKPTLVIVDPPRAGLTNKTMEQLQNLAPLKILYVSCNPTTLARDLKTLCAEGQAAAGAYRLKKIQPLDMFPQTYHVETVCLLERIPERI